MPFPEWLRFALNLHPVTIGIQSSEQKKRIPGLSGHSPRLQFLQGPSYQRVPDSHQSASHVQRNRFITELSWNCLIFSLSPLPHIGNGCHARARLGNGAGDLGRPEVG
jgi:hypothetical protein